jgi:hypothetical protein
MEVGQRVPARDAELAPDSRPNFLQYNLELEDHRPRVIPGWGKNAEPRDRDFCRNALYES